MMSDTLLKKRKETCMICKNLLFSKIVEVLYIFIH